MKRVSGHIAVAALWVALVPGAMAQTPEQDRRREYDRQQDELRQEQQRRAQEEMQRQQKATEDARKRQQQSDDESRRNLEDDSRRRAQATAAPAGQNGSDIRALRPKLLALPAVPNERNVLLGSWRLEGGGQQNKVLEFGLTGRGSTPGMAELMAFSKSIDSGQLACDMSFGRGMTFTPTTFSSGGAAGMAEGPVAYRSRTKQVIVAIPADSRANPMIFEIAGPNRIVWGGSCALVRVGTAHASAGTATTTTAPRSTLARPSPEVCRNTLIDKIGAVGVNQVRAMSDLRFKDAAIEGKVPNTNHLRIDLRGSACDDPRIKATLYDFDANEMLQSITYVWARAPGPAPAPVFEERARLLARWYAPGPTPSPSRWQGASTAARVTLQDLPERSLLLEAYSAPK